MPSSLLEFENVGKSYANANGTSLVLEGFNLRIARGEFVSIIGHSGCGKSTALMMAAGLTEITSGYIFLACQEIVGPGPDRGVVFQSPSLLPWLTALENVRLGVDRVYPRAARGQRDEICKYYLSRVGLADGFHKKAIDLSNGMKQRVGIARAFALKPRILLLDEPFGMLDSMSRSELQDVLMEIWSKEQITAMLVTHDIDEALFLSDRVIMMTNGPRAKVGDILEISIPRPRVRKDVIDHPNYYRYQGHLIDFLENGHRGQEKVSAAPVEKIPTVGKEEFFVPTTEDSNEPVPDTV